MFHAVCKQGWEGVGEVCARSSGAAPPAYRKPGGVLHSLGGLAQQRCAASAAPALQSKLKGCL